MKISVFIMALLLFGFPEISGAQKASVETASLSVKVFEKEDERIEVRIHSLQEAKEHIDQAYENPSTSNDPKMWLMRAKTYLAIHTDTLGANKKPTITDEDAVEKAAISMVNCHKTDENKKYVEDNTTYNLFVNIAVNAKYIADLAYNKKEYERSINYYKLTRSLVPYDDQNLLKRQNITDDGLLYNQATTEKYSGRNEEAKKHFLELIGRNYNDPWVYLELYDIYLNSDKDTANALKVIDQGRSRFDEDRNLKIQQIYMYDVTDRREELLAIMDQNVEDQPYSASNYYLRSLMYIKMNEVEKAIADLEKSVEYDEENIDANQELGELYYRKGANYMEEANTLSLNETERFNSLTEQAKEYFTKSIPCFERIYQYSEDSKRKGRAGQFLLQMYLKTGQMDKYKELKAEIQ